MAKTLHEILQMSWQRQAEHLQGMTIRELGILFRYLHQVPVGKEELEAFEKFYLAVYSILRDHREGA